MDKTRVRNREPIPLRKELKAICEPKNRREETRRDVLRHVRDQASQLGNVCIDYLVGNFSVTLNDSANKKIKYVVSFRRLRK